MLDYIMITQGAKENKQLITAPNRQYKCDHLHSTADSWLNDIWSKIELIVFIDFPPCPMFPPGGGGGGGGSDGGGGGGGGIVGSVEGGEEAMQVGRGSS